MYVGWRRRLVAVRFTCRKYFTIRSISWARYLVVVQAAARRETLQHNEVESNQLQKGVLNTKEGRMHNRFPTKKWRPGKTTASDSALP